MRPRGYGSAYHIERAIALRQGFGEYPCAGRVRSTALMPNLTISKLFVEIWTVCSPEEAHGNENSLVNACPTADHLDPEISGCSVVLEKKNLHCVQSRRSIGK